MRSRITLLFAVLATGAAISGSLVTGQSAPTATGPAVTAGTGIAYVRGGEVRLIQPDGTGDRLLWQSPSKAPRSPFVHPVRDLAWRPDGGELAFASDHEQAYSWFQDDIYAVRADGTGLRRLTNPPAKADLGRLPAGTVKLTWLPDGSGVIMSRRDSLMDDDVNLYGYDFASGRLRQLTDLHSSEEHLGRFSISPDGRQIVYESSSVSVLRRDRPGDLHIINRNGSNRRLLLKDAIFPAWSPASF